MNISGPVIVIEDDIDDHDLFLEVFHKLKYPNQIIFFIDGEKALEFLNRTDIAPFIILSDINMPKLDGFQLRNKIRLDAKLQIKCIPYLFFTTASSQKMVIDAYSLSVQGFFIKPNSLTELENTLRVIMEYWKTCVAPSSFEGQ